MMSREIDPDKIASGELDEDEVRYLSDRNLLPEGYKTKVDLDLSNKPVPLEEIPNTGDANTGPATGRTASATPEEDDEEGEEDYEEGWTNDERRAELSKRGLSVEGNKAELIQRLKDSDAEGETEEDETTE